jgi:hypothetical protein
MDRNVAGRWINRVVRVEDGRKADDPTDAERLDDEVEREEELTPNAAAP